MKIFFQEFRKDDFINRELFNMLIEIGPGENGYVNDGYNISFCDFKEYLNEKYNISKGINLPQGYVRETMYWLFDEENPVGIGRLRHSLNDKLLNSGGHIGYCIRPSKRGKGYGNVILREILRKAREMGIQKVLLTPNKDNKNSIRIIELHNGRLENIYQSICRYWIELL